MLNKIQSNINKRNIVLVGVLLVLAFFSFRMLATKEVVHQLPHVVVGESISADVSDSSSLSGELKPIREVDIAAKTGGRVLALSVDVGSRTTIDSAIAYLDTSTERATGASLDAQISAAERSLSATTNLYDATVNAVITGSSSTNSDTASLSALTDAAILVKRIDNTLGEFLAVRGGKENAISISYETELGAKDSSSKITAREALVAYQIADTEFQNFYHEQISGKSPTQATIDDGLARASTILSLAKTALDDAYTVFIATIPSTNISSDAITNNKTIISTLGSETQSTAGRIHDVHTGVETISMQRDTQIANANAQLVALRGASLVNKTILAEGGIRAPFAGVVTEKHIELGSVVAPGTPLIHLVDDSVLKVTVGVPDTMASQVKLGDRAQVLVDGASGTMFPARITKISPAVDPVSRKVVVEFTLENTARTLKSGSYARVILGSTRSDTIAVPRSAVFTRYGASYLFAVDGTRVHRRMIETGAVSDVLIEVTKGVALGEKIVTGGGDYLRDGDEVIIATSTTVLP